MRSMQCSLKEVLKKFGPFNALTTEQQDDIVNRTADAAEELIFDTTSDNANKTS